MKVKDKIIKIKDKLLNIFFPNNFKCIFCEKEIFKNNNSGVCDECLNRLPFIGEKVCLKCGDELLDMGNFCLRCKSKISKSYNRAFAPFKFEGKIVNVIHDLKYHNKKYLADYLSKFMFNCFSAQNLIIDIVIPIPLNAKRFKERGYNQAELLCKSFKENGYEIDVTNLIRSKYTQTQTNLTTKERKENLKNAFTVLNKNYYKDKNILLVDDVFTTGATMEEAAKVLKQCKAKTVYCLTLAHVQIKQQKQSKNIE